MADIILITHWTGGDVYPFIRLGKLLRKVGHNVTLFTHCIYETKALEAGLHFVAVDTPEEYANINRDLHMLADPIGNKSAYLNFYMEYHGHERLLREVQMIEKVCSEDSIIIARYRSSISGQLVAEKHKLRYASLILAPNYFSHMELHDQMFGKELRDEINLARAEMNLEPIAGWKDWLYSPEHILCGWPKWYAQPDETWPKSAYPIGFLEESSECEMCINDPDKAIKPEDDFITNARKNNKKIAVITGGSSRMVSKKFYQTAVDACLAAGVFGILVTPYEEYVPENVTDEIKWMHHVSLRELMKKVDIILHHGGMGTINEAIDAALPQIILPHLTDGPDNADRLVNLGIAAKFSPKMWNADEIANEMDQALNDEMKQRCKKYRQMNADTYEEKLWNLVLEELRPYILPQQKLQVADNAENDKVQRQVSRERLLEMIKKKQKK